MSSQWLVVLAALLGLWPLVRESAEEKREKRRQREARIAELERELGL